VILTEAARSAWRQAAGLAKAGDTVTSTSKKIGQLTIPFRRKMSADTKWFVPTVSFVHPWACISLLPGMSG